MFMMYVDESGDVGLVKSPSRYFVLTGLVLHSSYWNNYLDELVEFRKTLKTKYGYKLREEVHGGSILTKPGELARIHKSDRLAILRLYAKKLTTMNSFRVINIVVDKNGKPGDYDVFEVAWRALIQRFENTIQYNNFPRPSLDISNTGIIFPDHTDDKKLLHLIRKMRRYNPVPNLAASGYRSLTLQCVVEDPNMRDSRDSYFIQSVDLCSFLLYQKLSPSVYIRKKSAQNYFKLIDPILCKVASRSDPYGIVTL